MTLEFVENSLDELISLKEVSASSMATFKWKKFEEILTAVLFTESEEAMPDLDTLFKVAQTSSSHLSADFSDELVYFIEKGVERMELRPDNLKDFASTFAKVQAHVAPNTKIERRNISALHEVLMRQANKISEEDMLNVELW